MKPTVAPSFVTSLFAERNYEGLAWLTSVICGSATFDLQHPTYALPRPLFMVVEGLAWFAQGIRSGAWTYFESTPVTRQREMLAALRESAPAGFYQQYEFGIEHWQDSTKMTELDRWLVEFDEENNEILWRVLGQNRKLLDSFIEQRPGPV